MSGALQEEPRLQIPLSQAERLPLITSLGFQSTNLLEADRQSGIHYPWEETETPALMLCSKEEGKDALKLHLLRHTARSTSNRKANLQ